VFIPLDAKIKVFVSVLPQVYFVERIGGDRVDVQPFVTPGRGPDTYVPTPAQIEALARASTFFKTGIPFEKGFVAKLEQSMPGLKIVDVRGNCLMREDADHDHDHDGGDPHVWLDPVAVILQAEIIRDQLTLIDPDGRHYYSNAYDLFRADLEEIDRYLKALFKAVQGRAFYVYHPAFGCFADRYNLVQKANPRHPSTWSALSERPKRITPG